MSQRWVKDRGYIETPPEVEKFLNSVARASKRYGLCLTFDLDTSSLVIEPINEDGMRWLMGAQVDPRVAAGLIRED